MSSRGGFGLQDKKSLVRGILGRDPVAGGPLPSGPGGDFGNPLAQAAPGGSTGAGAGPGDGDGDEKITGQQAGYTDQAPQCGNCDAFIADGQPCQKISDPVSGGGFCRVHSSLVNAGNTDPNAGQSQVEPSSGGAENTPDESDQGDQGDQGDDSDDEQS